MNTWRWLAGFLGATGVLVACTTDPKPSTDDESNTTTTGTETTTTGTTTNTTTSTTSTTATCAQQATFLDCANCYCMLDQPGCGAYLDTFDEHITCGTTCGTGSTMMACGPYCQTFEAGTPDQNLLDMTCETCINTIMQGSADANAFVAACQASAQCTAFGQNLGTCPQG